MNWIDKLERRYGNLGIPNLINGLLIGQLAAGIIILFFNRNFDKNACFLSPHCLLYSYKNAGCFLCRSSAWAPPGRTEEAA